MLQLQKKGHNDAKALLRKTQKTRRYCRVLTSLILWEWLFRILTCGGRFNFYDISNTQIKKLFYDF